MKDGKIYAIKFVRVLTGLGLLECKRIVEYWSLDLEIDNYSDATQTKSAHWQL